MGRSARVKFTLRGRPVAKVRLHVLNASDRSRLGTIDLGERAAGSHSVAFTGLETGAALPEGKYVLHIAGRRLRRGPGATSIAELEFRHHTFPISGSFGWGEEGSRFGAPRKVHSIRVGPRADEGTPLVAPRGGVVGWGVPGPWAGTTWCSTARGGLRLVSCTSRRLFPVWWASACVPAS